MCDIPDTIENKRETYKKTGPTYVQFEPVVQLGTGKSKANAYYHRVCGPGGLLELKGKKISQFATQNCSSVVDYDCYGTECKCLATQPLSCDVSSCRSALGRITLPQGVEADVYTNWDCSGKEPTATLVDFGQGGTTQTVSTGPMGQQAFHFKLSDGYECEPGTGLVKRKDGSGEEVGVGGAKAEKEEEEKDAASDQAAEHASFHKMILIAGGGFLGLLLLAAFLGGKKRDKKDLTNRQILESVGLVKGKGGGSGPAGSIRAALKGQTIKSEKK